jgi:signal transduction histidine kinase
MASKFLKNKKAAEESSEKLRRLIARTGDDPEQLATLHETLASRGLSEEGWQELMIARDSSSGADAGDSAGGLGDIKALTLLLAKLGETIDQSRTAPITEALHELAGETHRQMETLAAKTEKKIATLRRMLDHESLDASGKPIQLSRKQLMEFLAEIGQELSQPLTVVSATIDMLRAQRAGILTEAQGELLNMTADSTSRLAHLVDCLIRIAGNPLSTHPDQTILSALYNKPNP